MKKLYVLVRSGEEARQKLTYKLLAEACQNQGVELVTLEQEKKTFSAESKRLIEAGAGFYRLSTGPAPAFAEQLLVRPDISTIYEPWRLPLLSTAWIDTLLMSEKELPIIPTEFLFADHPREEIDELVRKLGGYPVVLKYTGFSHGKGVSLCHSFDEVAEVIAKTDKKRHYRLAMRRFIENATHIRVVVIGDKAVDAIKYDQPEDDFRTNAANTPTAEPYDAPKEVLDLAVKAAQAFGVKLTGVDILIDGAGRPWLAEANTPCNFGRNYLTNGKNLAEELVKLLVG